jgi:hypothetical protein
LNRYQQGRRTWQKLSIGEKLSLVKIWYIIVLVGDVCLILGTIFIIIGQEYPMALSEIFVGFGTFCIWASVTKYLSATDDYSLVMRTAKAAMPLIARVWFGIMPILIGIAFLSITLLWEVDDCFGTFGKSFYTQFSVQAGDALFDTYHVMVMANYWYGMFFAYCYIFFAISIVQNIFMVIVEDSYIQIKYSKNFDWLNKDK